MPDPELPKEINNFSKGIIGHGREGVSLAQYEALHVIELKDVAQQIKMRPWVALFFGFLLLVQNYIVFKLVWWALESDRLGDLQWIFGTLVAASLIETYKISSLIVNKLFEPIDYADKHQRF